jgi:methenyltetrahydrofolate cyclohydrolase
MHSARLVELPVRDFVDAVGSADQPVPAGGSVAALTGAASAALLALVCEVLERKTPGVLAETLQSARSLQHQLLDLVDQDAAAFRAFLDAGRGTTARRAAAGSVARIPLQIGRASVEVLELARTLEEPVAGPMRLDVSAAEQLASAAARAALAIAEDNVRMLADPSAQQSLRDEIVALRRRAP